MYTELTIEIVENLLEQLRCRRRIEQIDEELAAINEWMASQQ